MDISLLPEKKDIPLPKKSRRITARDIQLIVILLLVVTLFAVGGLLLLRSRFLGIEFVPGSIIPQIKQQPWQQLTATIPVSSPTSKDSWSRVISDQSFSSSDLWLIVTSGTQAKLGTADLLAQTFKLSRLLPPGASQIKVYSNNSVSFLRNQNSLEAQGNVEIPAIYTASGETLTNYYLDRQNEDAYMLLASNQNKQRILLLTARGKQVDLIPELSYNVDKLITLTPDRTAISAIDYNRECWNIRLADKKMEKIECHLAYPQNTTKLWTNYLTLAGNKLKGSIYQVDIDNKITNLLTLPEGELATDAYKTAINLFYIKHKQAALGSLWQAQPVGIYGYKENIETELYLAAANEKITQLRLRGNFLYFIVRNQTDGSEKITGIDLTDNSTITVNLDICIDTTCYYEFISD